ncbi:MAG: flippase [Desulfobacterales bacterium]|nr:flippase [Desulfobacterales bacterium]
MHSPIHATQGDLSKLAKGAGAVFFGTIFGSIVTYVYNVYIARTLGSELYGSYSLGLYVFNIAAVVSLMGLHTAILRYVALYNGASKHEKTKGAIISGLSLALPMSVATAAALYTLSDFLAVRLFHELLLGRVLRMFAIGIPFINVSTLLMFATQGFQIVKYRVYIRNAFEPVGKLLFAAIFLFFGWQLDGVLRAFVLTLIITSVLFSRSLLKISPQLREGIRPEYVFKELIIFSLPLIPVSILQAVTQRMEPLILGNLCSPYEVGLYSAAYQTAMLITIVLMSLNIIFAPMISDLHNKGELPKLESLFRIVTRWAFTLCIPLVVMTIFFAREILQIFGSQFVAAAGCLVILALGQLGHSATGPVAFMLMMSGRTMIILVNASLALLLKLILNILLIPKFGLVGAATAAAISIIILNLAMVVQVFYVLRMHPFVPSFFKPIFCGIAAILIVYAVKFLANIDGLVGLFILGLTFMAFYAILITLYGMNSEDRMVFSAIKRRALGVR